MSDPNKKYEEILMHLAQEYNIDMSKEQSAKLLKHLDLVLEKNKVLNLTSITEPEDALILHVLDSIILIPFIMNTTGKFADLGTGAGFPGVPLAIMTRKKGILVDSVKKKIKALDEFIVALELEEQLKTSTERIETLGKLERGKIGCVVARALAPLPVLVEYASPLLKTNGRLIVTKGRPIEQEVISGIKAAKICGLELLDREKIVLPEEFGTREIFIFSKTGKAKIKIPREVGKAKKEPLA